MKPGLEVQTRTISFIKPRPDRKIKTRTGGKNPDRKKQNLDPERTRPSLVKDLAGEARRFRKRSSSWSSGGKIANMRKSHRIASNHTCACLLIDKILCNLLAQEARAGRCLQFIGAQLGIIDVDVDNIRI